MTQVVLTAEGAGTWPVPSDCTLISRVDILGGGGDGHNGVGGALLGGSGGGGAEHVYLTNITVTPSSIVNFHIGIHGTLASGNPGGTPASPNTCDTWFVTPFTVFAQGGSNGPNGGGGGTLGGSGPGVHTRGGSSPSSADIIGSTGGAGAGGPHGIGAEGGGVELFPFQSGGGGGGGADGGAVGGVSTGAPGANGGNNRLSTGQGLGAATGVVDGANGTDGGGGGGGFGYHDDHTPPAANTSGGGGSAESLWGAGIGPGSGGGGAGIDAGNGGDAGGYGGGGGGPGFTGTPGMGTSGLIVITYTPTPASRPNKGVVYSKHHIKFSGIIPPGTAPVNLTAPVINQAVVGQPTVGTAGNWSGTRPINYTYQYKVVGIDVGTDSPIYTPVSGDNTKTLQLFTTATNAYGSVTVGSNIITVSSDMYISIADRAALFVMLDAGPIASGNKSYRLAGTDFGTLGIYSYDFNSAPIVLSGQTTPGQTTATWMELSGSSGMTWTDITFNGFNSSIEDSSISIHSSTNADLTFDRIISDSGDPQGTQSGGGYWMRNNIGCNIIINGRSDASLIDIQGRNYAIGILDCDATGSITVAGLTIDNYGVDCIIGSGADNVTINGVLISNSHWGAGDHPDAIQFSSSFDTHQPTSNLIIKNCGINTGAFGSGMQGIFLEDVQTVVLQDNWIYSGTFNNAIAMARGTTALIDNNFAQGFNSPAGGGDIISRGGTIDNTVTNNSASAVTNYSADGINPGYIPVTLPGTNIIISNATAYGDFSELDAWLVSHPTARPRT